MQTIIAPSERGERSWCTSSMLTKKALLERFCKVFCSYPVWIAVKCSGNFEEGLQGWKSTLHLEQKLRGQLEAGTQTRQTHRYLCGMENHPTIQKKPAIFLSAGMYKRTKDVSQWKIALAMKFRSIITAWCHTFIPSELDFAAELILLFKWFINLFSPMDREIESH